MNNLSPREREVLDLAGQGMINKEIARELFISLETVKTHFTNIYIKLGARNRAHAIRIITLMG
jgi:DNA-binding CsgD family transcriptional regulator